MTGARAGRSWRGLTGWKVTPVTRSSCARSTSPFVALSTLHTLQRPDQLLVTSSFLRSLDPPACPPCRSARCATLIPLRCGRGRGLSGVGGCVWAGG